MEPRNVMYDDDYYRHQLSVMPMRPVTCLHWIKSWGHAAWRPTCEL